MALNVVSTSPPSQNLPNRSCSATKRGVYRRDARKPGFTGIGDSFPRRDWRSAVRGKVLGRSKNIVRAVGHGAAPVGVWLLPQQIAAGAAVARGSSVKICFGYGVSSRYRRARASRRHQLLAR
jgi:hypothetical protein